MYFASRLQAGRMLGSLVSEQYQNKDCAVVALDDGGVVVGSQIAIRLHCIITMLQSNDITLPHEPQPIAGVTSDGSFTYNHLYSPGEIDEMAGENRNYLEEERIQRYHEIDQLIGHGGLISPKLLKKMNVILVSDGLDNPMKLDLASQFLKPIEIENLIVAVPLASVPVIDRIHVLADAVYCLSVVDDYISTDHYYDQHDIPDHQQIIKSIEEIVLNWK